jgi:hypothetical protein
VPYKAEKRSLYLHRRRDDQVSSAADSVSGHSPRASMTHLSVRRMVERTVMPQVYAFWSRRDHRLAMCGPAVPGARRYGMQVSTLLAAGRRYSRRSRRDLHLKGTSDDWLSVMRRHAISYRGTMMQPLGRRDIDRHLSDPPPQDERHASAFIPWSFKREHTNRRIIPKCTARQVLAFSRLPRQLTTFRPPGSREPEE